MKKLQLPTLILLLCLSMQGLADSIDGAWKHPDENVWIEVNVEDDVGRVIRNDKAPERAGFDLLRGLTVAKDEAEVWKGQVYAKRAEEYKDATLSLPGPDVLRLTVKVGFITRKIDWERAPTPVPH